MLKFISGTAVGVIFALAFVWFDFELPAIFDLPDKVKKNVVSTAVEFDLYDLSADIETRERALEVFFKNRAGDAVKADAAAGHPLLAALYRARAAREARQLSAEWGAFDKALDQASLRGALEKKYATSDGDALKRAMLMDALDRKPFLKAWLQERHTVTAENLSALLQTTGAQPQEANESSAAASGN